MGDVSASDLIPDMRKHLEMQERSSPGYLGENCTNESRVLNRMIPSYFEDLVPTKTRPVFYGEKRTKIRTLQKNHIDKAHSKQWMNFTGTIWIIWK